MNNLTYIPSDIDLLCIFPGVQQVVGVSTVLANCVKSFYDVALHIHDLGVKIFGGVSYQEWRDLNIEADLSRWEGDDENEKAAYIEKNYGEGRNLQRHLYFILIGVIRATPILGSVFSLYHFYKPIS